MKTALLKNLSAWSFAALFAVAAATTQAAPSPADDDDASTAKFLASLDYRQGQVAVPEAQATFRLDSHFRFLPPADARRVLEDFWGNPPDDTVLGLLVPSSVALDDEHAWAVVVTYSDEGYVSDADAKAIDYDQLLAELREQTQADNAERKAAGYDSITLIGWAAPPRYDATAKKLYWAQEFAFGGESGHTVNYDIRVLGRQGVLSLNAVADMADLPIVKTGMEELLPMVDFDAGARYADYNASTDKLAAYGLGALIAGGVAAKAGLFGKLAAMLIAAKKILIPVAVGLFALVARVLRGKKAQG